MRIEAEDLRNLRIEPRERVRIRDRPQHTNTRTLADRKHAGVAVTLFIHGDDETSLERRKEKGASRVTQMVLNVYDAVHRSAILKAKEAMMAHFPRQPTDLGHL